MALLLGGGLRAFRLLLSKWLLSCPTATSNFWKTTTTAAVVTRPLASTLPPGPPATESTSESAAAASTRTAEQCPGSALQASQEQQRQQGEERHAADKGATDCPICLQPVATSSAVRFFLDSEISCGCPARFCVHCVRTSKEQGIRRCPLCNLNPRGERQRPPDGSGLRGEELEMIWEGRLPSLSSVGLSLTLAMETAEARHPALATGAQAGGSSLSELARHAALHTRLICRGLHDTAFLESQSMDRDLFRELMRFILRRVWRERRRVVQQMGWDREEVSEPFIGETRTSSSRASALAGSGPGAADYGDAAARSSLLCPASWLPPSSAFAGLIADPLGDLEADDDALLNESPQRTGGLADVVRYRFASGASTTTSTSSAGEQPPPPEFLHFLQRHLANEWVEEGVLWLGGWEQHGNREMALRRAAREDEIALRMRQNWSVLTDDRQGLGEGSPSPLWSERWADGGTTTIGSLFTSTRDENYPLRHCGVLHAIFCGLNNWAWAREGMSRVWGRLR